MTTWTVNLQMPGKKFKYSFGIRAMLCNSEELVDIKVVGFSYNAQVKGWI